MNILITGSNGQLGNEIKRLSEKYPAWNFIFTDVEELDITDMKAVEDFLSKEKTDIVINCAAYTAVDKAESDMKKAWLINAAAVKNLAVICGRYGKKLIHISTDFIFDGKINRPYTESDIPKPLSVYGKTKLKGEKEIRKYCKKAVIIRTSWLYSEFGGNFVKNIIRMAKEKKKLTIIYDQVGTPTYARDLAEAILNNLEHMEFKGCKIYNYSNEGVASWYDFAIAACEFAGIDCEITPIETKEYLTPAQRPPYSVLNKAGIKRDLGVKIPYWRDSLKECVERLNIK